MTAARVNGVKIHHDLCAAAARPPLAKTMAALMCGADLRGVADAGRLCQAEGALVVAGPISRFRDANGHCGSAS